MERQRKCTCCNECPNLKQTYVPIPGPLRFQIWKTCSVDGTYIGKFTKFNRDRNIPVPNWCPCGNNNES